MVDEHDEDQHGQPERRPWPGRIETPPGRRRPLRRRGRRALGRSRLGVGVGVVQRHGDPAYGGSDHPKWSRGPWPAPSRQPRRPGQGPGHEGLGRRDRLGHVDAAGQVRRDGGREGAARCRGRCPWPPARPRRTATPSGPATTSSADAAEVAALDHHVARPGGAEPLGHGDPGRRRGHERLDVVRPEDGRLAQVGGGDEGMGQQEVEVGVDPGVLHQPVPAGGDEDGVHDQAGEPPGGGQGGHLGDDAGRWPACRSSRRARRNRRAPSRSAAARSSGSSATTPRTSAVFCAVTAVSAHVPCTRSAAKVLRSACTPAPPPESDPAMVSAVGGVAVASGTGPP